MYPIALTEPSEGLSCEETFPHLELFAHGAEVGPHTVAHLARKVPFLLVEEVLYSRDPQH